MAECPSCNAPIKDGDWTCGQCGTPVAGADMPPAAGQYGGGTTAYSAAATPAYGGPGQWAPEYQPQPAAPAAEGSGGLLRLVVVAGVIAIIAIVLVWFFMLRGPATTGEEYLGAWTASTEQGIATIQVADDGEALSVTMTGSRSDQRITVPAHLDGENLVITMDDFSQIAGEENAEAFKTTLQALAGDFRMVFSSVDATHLDLRIVGTAPGGEDYDETIQLTKDAAGTT